jgi:dipeptidyl aminopeptidase/acylaminoacyl peptidase
MERRFSTPQRAKAADVMLFTRESVREFPDLWVSGFDFADMREISDANPQQSEYIWADVELVTWRSADGVSLEGLLYKPEDFDSSQTYPTVVNFYERDSDNLYRHHAPVPHRSVIRPTFYASRGYLVFMPDVRYRVGYPGESALNAVVPGVLSLVRRGYVDANAIGVQGHSWGGYQIAYMVTRSNLFKAAAGGAPVANMVSAYGGIRWGSGMSRMFQYERTQSRLGATLWEAPMRYIENSPIFWADKVETPLLMMHNDEDHAVPWYQGIEMFVALRRLGKPAWLVNYNGERHWPTDYHEKRDWNIRMQQFFDHYLKGDGPPVWLAAGIPATAKGKTLGLEPAEVEPAATGGREP